MLRRCEPPVDVVDIIILLDDNIHDMPENSAICNSSKTVIVLVSFHVAIIKYPHKGLERCISG